MLSGHSIHRSLGVHINEIPFEDDKKESKIEITNKLANFDGFGIGKDIPSIKSNKLRFIAKRCTDERHEN